MLLLAQGLVFWELKSVGTATNWQLVYITGIKIISKALNMSKVLLSCSFADWVSMLTGLWKSAKMIIRKLKRDLCLVHRKIWDTWK